MADRFFPVNLPEFVEEEEGAVTGSTLFDLLHLPYPKLVDKLLNSALHLKQKVVEETWLRSGRGARDYTLYTGALGTAFLLFKAYHVTKNRADLDLCAEIVMGCHQASQGSPLVTFICGKAGVCALGAVVAKEAGDEGLLNLYLSSFREIKFPHDVPNELLYGRAGYLWACSFLNKHIGEGTIPSTHMSSVAKDMIRDGKKLASKSSCPLMYEWNGERYWGAAHGLAGIMHALMDVNLNEDDLQYVKGTLDYMINNRFISGNYPSTEGFDADCLVHWCPTKIKGYPLDYILPDVKDCLVHWCHGAPGVALTLTKAAQVLQDHKFLPAAAEAADVVWERGLLKRVGICHGVSGNVYVFLSLYRLTGNMKYLGRAKAFVCFLLDWADKLIAEGLMHGGDHPYSLFEGQAGMAYLFFDMINLSEARFPAYEL